MLFNSYEFLLFFLPVVVAAYFAILSFPWRREPNQNANAPRLANAFLVAASFFFYAWWRAEYLWLLVVSIGVNFVVGRAIMHRAVQDLPTRTLLVLGIAFNLLLLGYF